MHGQTYHQNDTIKINDVIISRKEISTGPAGYKETTIDSSVLKNYSHSTLAEILSVNTMIFIKSYGMGGIATPSFRGTGASHTQITWNGINLNFPMHGQVDLSLIPVGLIDGIQIYYGGASMAFNSGGIGGIINLEAKPDWKNETSLAINPGLGSYGHYTGLIKLKTGTMRFQSATKVFFQSAENNFRYLNDQIGADPVWEIRKNSQVRQKGLVQELYFRHSNSTTSARLWYQSADRNLPSSMLVSQSAGEKQFDESFRTMVNHDLFIGGNSYSFAGAFLLSNLNYTNRLASINSRNLSETVILKAGMERSIGEFMRLKLLINEELSISKTNNYSQNVTRNTASATMSAERAGPGRFGSMILIREILDKNKLLVPDFSAGLQYRLTEGKSYFLKANISRNSKLPSLNDMFWLPGGNPDLKNEHAFMYELGYDMSGKISGSMNYSYNLAFYRNDLKDMIQWNPGEFSYWIADNVQNVTSMGMETSVSVKYALNNVTTRFRAGYSFTSAENKGSDVDSGEKQLIYVPEHQANVSVHLFYRQFYSGIVTNMTGKRYTTADNSAYLPGYVMNSVLTGYKMRVNETTLDINFNINNLLNVNYQTMAYYPLPGRSYSVKLLIQFKKLNK